MFGFLKKREITSGDSAQEREEDFNDIEAVAAYFKRETGVAFEQQISIFKNKVTRFCKNKEICSHKNLLKMMRDDASLRQEFIDAHTTNETFFYREFHQIQELIERVKKRDDYIEILCAPGATGEEPYSIAIALLEAGVPQKQFHIVAVDINQSAIQRAKEGIYKERVLRNLTPQIKNDYFAQSGILYAVHENIKALVTFRVVNIFESSFKSIGKFDFIFSRNMLIYFDKETKLRAKEILESLRKNQTQAIFFGHADLL